MYFYYKHGNEFDVIVIYEDDINTFGTHEELPKALIKQRF